MSRIAHTDDKEVMNDPQWLHCELDKLNEEIHRIENKLANPGFVSKAPAAFIEKEKTRLSEFKHSQQVLSEQLQKLETH